MKPLSPAMRRAIEFAREDGGKLYRRLNGSWATGRERGAANSTIHALVERGLAEYTKWKSVHPDSLAECWPIEAALTPKAGEV